MVIIWLFMKTDWNITTEYYSDMSVLFLKDKSLWIWLLHSCTDFETGDTLWHLPTLPFVLSAAVLYGTQQKNTASLKNINKSIFDKYACHIHWSKLAVWCNAHLEWEILRVSSKYVSRSQVEKRYSSSEVSARRFRQPPPKLFIITRINCWKVTVELVCGGAWPALPSFT
jgi:hypothetical protein